MEQKKDNIPTGTETQQKTVLALMVKIIHLE